MKTLIQVDVDYFNQVNNLLKMVAPFINAGVRLPEADIRTVRQIVMNIKQHHAEIDSNLLAVEPGSFK